jgi:hypothetical protein
MLLARLDELSDPRLRKTLARSFRRIARDVYNAGRPMTPAQHDRRTLQPHTEQIQRLADRLEDRSRPAGPRGIAMAYRLVMMGRWAALQLPSRAGASGARERTMGALDESLT